jgi:hypothetical protein
VSRQFAHKILGLFGRLFSEDLRGFRGRGGEGGSTIWRGPSGVFEAHRGTPVPPASENNGVIENNGVRSQHSTSHVHSFLSVRTPGLES